MVRTNIHEVRILATLTRQPAWWWGPDLSRAARVSPMHLYPAIDRLEREGMVHSEWAAQPKPGEGARRRYIATSLAYPDHAYADAIKASRLRYGLDHQFWDADLTRQPGVLKVQGELDQAAAEELRLRFAALQQSMRATMRDVGHTMLTGDATRIDLHTPDCWCVKCLSEFPQSAAADQVEAIRELDATLKALGYGPDEIARRRAEAFADAAPIPGRAARGRWLPPVLHDRWGEPNRLQSFAVVLVGFAQAVLLLDIWTGWRLLVDGTIITTAAAALLLLAYYAASAERQRRRQKRGGQ